MPGALPADVLCLRKKLMLSGVKREAWWKKGEGEHELAFAFHIRNHKVLWYKGDKVAGDEWKATFYADKEWITGTADWADSRQVGKVWHFKVDDLKTGRWPVDAVENRQLLTYAMPFWLEHGKPLDCIVVVSITQWPRYPLHGRPKRREWRTDGLTLAMHLVDLQYALDHPEDANPSKDNCMFCECKNNCSDYLVSGLAK